MYVESAKHAFCAFQTHAYFTFCQQKLTNSWKHVRLMSKNVCLSLFVSMHRYPLCREYPKKMIYLPFFIPPKGQDSLPEASQKEWGGCIFWRENKKIRALWSQTEFFFFFFWFDKINQNIFAVLIVGWFWLLLYCYFLEALSLSLSFSLGSVLDF